MIWALLAAALSGAGLVAYATRNLFRREDSSEPTNEPCQEKVERRTLKQLSCDWIGVIDFMEIAKIWREPESKKETPFPRPTFGHGEIDQFYSDMVERRYALKGARRSVVVKLLEILDKEGDCPSVVRMNPLEAEGKFPDDTFSMLATIPLYRHTLQVARKCASKIDQEIMLPDVLIVSLAHDIGKIPSYHNRLYTTGDHPLIAPIVLNGIAEYASLGNSDELDRIVRGHHLLKMDNNPLTELLKQCDQEVRNEELGKLVSCAIEQDRERGDERDGKGSVPPPVKGSERPGGNDVLPADEERAHPLDGGESREVPSPVAQEIPDWFDADAILAAVKRMINVLETTAKGEKWQAVSTDMGIVFVNPNGLWSAIKEVSGKDPAVLAADADKEAKRNLLYTVVWELSKTRNAIATQYVAPNFYTTKATVVTGGGKGFSALLVPFNVEAFGETPSALEGLKSSQLQKMVREIRPKQTEVETCAI